MWRQPLHAFCYPNISPQWAEAQSIAADVARRQPYWRCSPTAHRQRLRVGRQSARALGPTLPPLGCQITLC